MGHRRAGHHHGIDLRVGDGCAQLRLEDGEPAVAVDGPPRPLGRIDGDHGAELALVGQLGQADGVDLADGTAPDEPDPDGHRRGPDIGQMVAPGRIGAAGAAGVQGLGHRPDRTRRAVRSVDTLAR